MVFASVNQCAHDWIISLTQQEEEHLLDAILVAAVQSMLSGYQVQLYVQKYLSGTDNCTMLNQQINSQPLDVQDIAIIIDKLSNNKAINSKVDNHRVCYIPMYHLGRVIGFTLVKGEVPQQTISPVVSLLNIYANQLYLLYRARLDSFTELLNRQTFDKKLLEIISGKGFLCDRPNSSKMRNWHLAMLDIDHFKSVNDNFGHIIGDEVILLVARVLKQSFRNEDYVFRYGGEEFAVLFRCENETKAIETLERVRKRIAEFDFPQVGNITISSGVTELLNSSGAQSLVQQADTALYQSKHKGRNTVTAFCHQSNLGNKDSDIELF